MMIATISAISFVLGATVACVAGRYPGHREAIEIVGSLLLTGWAVHSSSLYRHKPERTTTTQAPHSLPQI
jgi:hypothetical protein